MRARTSGADPLFRLPCMGYYGPMIGKLSGVCGGISTQGTLLVEVGGVGYAVRTTLSHLAGLREGARVSLHIHTSVRDDAIDLYGFPSEEEVSFFRLLLGVSGIGPKTALSILNLDTVPGLRAAIARGDIPYLTRISGIGKKSAERVVVELRDKLAKLGYGAGDAALSSDAEVLDALGSLGYKAEEAREAIRKVPPEVRGVGERLRETLKRLSP